jgi:hypothetical protein
MQEKNKHIAFWLQGQSNATGATPSTTAPADLKKELIGCNLFLEDKRTWETLKVGTNTSNYPFGYLDQFNVVYQNNNQFGIELRLSKLLRDYYGSQIWCYKYAWPGSGMMAAGQGGQWDSLLSNQLFYKSQQYYKAARRFSSPVPQFLIWIQGESDASNTGTTPEAYLSKFTQFVIDSRKLYGQEMWIIVITLSTAQTAINSTRLADFKVMQRSMGSVLYTASTDTFTIQSGGSVINNCLVIDHNEACQNESGTFIHYNATAFENIANYCIKGIKQYIIK